jgi:hypothetical protein
MIDKGDIIMWLIHKYMKSYTKSLNWEWSKGKYKYKLNCEKEIKEQ